jgi:pimeloyl-ACP methyl ester carboxylesterase
MMGLKAELVPDAFMQDCDWEAVAGALGRLTRQSLAAFWQSPRAVAWREKPSTYVVCAEDRATPAWAQREFAGRADRVVELPTGHHPMLSRPEQLALVLAEAAGRTDDRQCPDTWPATNRRTRPDGRSGTMVGAPARYWP